MPAPAAGALPHSKKRHVAAGNADIFSGIKRRRPIALGGPADELSAGSGWDLIGNGQFRNAFVAGSTLRSGYVCAAVAVKVQGINRAWFPDGIQTSIFADCYLVFLIFIIFVLIFCRVRVFTPNIKNGILLR